MPDIELPDHLVDRLCGLPYGPTGPAARARVERAINAALDEIGWPRGPRGALDIPTEHWFVNIWDKRGTLKGHVGPITTTLEAQRVAKSWRQTGCSALHTRRGMGQPLTNPGA